MPIHNPTLDDFLRCARQEFHFLQPDFGFREWTSGRLRVNQFQVRYRNATTLVNVDGINWGYGVNVLLGPRRQPLFRPGDTFPLWPIVKLKRPDLYDRLAVGDQLAQLSTWAAALKECAGEVLRGDFGICADVEVRNLVKQVTLGERSDLAEWRYRTDTEKADEAFRSKDFHRVVDILVRHENRLTPAQRLKLNYSKGKCR